MHLLRGPSEDLTGQFLSTWRRSCMSRCWEHSRARKHVPRGKRSWRCAQCKQRKGSTLKRKRGEVCWQRKHLPNGSITGFWFVKCTGLMLRLFPKSLLKEPDLMAHKNWLFQEQYRGPNPLLHTCLKRLRALGNANHCLGVCRLAPVASITVRRLHAPLGKKGRLLY